MKDFKKMTKEELIEHCINTKHLPDRINHLEKELETLNTEKDKTIRDLVKMYDEKIAKIQDALNTRIKQLNKSVAFHGNLIKAVQGTLDNAIELNDYFTDEILGK